MENDSWRLETEKIFRNKIIKKPLEEKNDYKLIHKEKLEGNPILVA